MHLQQGTAGLGDAVPAEFSSPVPACLLVTLANQCLYQRMTEEGDIHIRNLCLLGNGVKELMVCDVIIKCTEVSAFLINQATYCRKT